MPEVVAPVRTIHIIDATIEKLRNTMREHKPDESITVSKAILTALCDEIEKLERDVELAKQDWKE